MKKIMFATAIFIIAINVSKAQSQVNSFNEQNFIKYVNAIRINYPITKDSNDVNKPYADTLISKLSAQKQPEYVNMVIHSEKQNRKLNQSVVTIYSSQFDNIEYLFSEIVRPIKISVLKKKKGHYRLYYKQFDDRVIILFKVVR
jgi:hypothetical protein